MRNILNVVLLFLTKFWQKFTAFLDKDVPKMTVVHSLKLELIEHQRSIGEDMVISIAYFF